MKNEIGWFLLIALDKVEKEEDELKDSISQIKWHINDLKVFRFSLKESFISCSFRAEIAKDQTQSLTLWIAELQYKLNLQPHRVSTVKARA